MENIGLVNYDAHIKTHQRHILISWLESAKNEKISKLKEEKTVLPENPVSIPDVVEAEEKLCCDLKINKHIFDVATKNDIAVIDDKVDLFVQIDKGKFKNINIERIEINDSKIDFRVDIESEEFCNVNNGSVKLPDEIGVFKVDVKKNYNNILTQNNIVAGNKKTDLNIEIDRKGFEDIKLERIEPEDDNYEFVIKIDKSRFEEIKFDEIKVVDGNSDVYLKIEKPDLEFNGKIVSPDKTVIPEIKVESEKFSSIKQDKIIIPDKISEFALAIDNNANVISNKKVKLPQQVADLKIDIQSKVFDGISVSESAVEPNAYDFNLDIKEPDCDIPDEVELPQGISNYKGTINQPEIDINFNKINIIPDKVELGLGDSVDNVAGLQMSKIKAPKSVTIPILQLQNINRQETQVCRVDVPDNSDILQILKNEQSKLMM
ncbi:MAG: hypothetical protein UD936_10625 [Acutalibacteraceae bacterium]|nr:hypothetical protein [Acutalibacteraceae bacterium]